MKRIIIALACLLCIAGIVFAQSVTAYRAGAIIKMDTTATIVDEDGGWTISNAQLKKLSRLQAGAITTTNADTSTITFTTLFTSAPNVTVSGYSNDAPFLVSISTSNAVIGTAAGTGRVINWVAVGR